MHFKESQINGDIHRPTQDNRQGAPKGGDCAFSQNQSEEEGDRAAIDFQPTVLENEPLDDEAEENREPEKIHRIRARDGVARRVKRRPEIPRPHKGQSE